MKKLLFAALLIAGSAHAENADLGKIESYLNNISTLEANFVQMSSNGSSAEGKIYIEKPSKIRMEYTAPDPLLIVGNGEYIIYNDKELDQITNIDYKDIPATMILSNKIKFDGKNLKVTDFYKDSGQTSVTVEMPNSPGVKPITLIFDNAPFRLKQWKVIDQQNIEVTISLFDAEQDKKLSENLFKFNKKSEKASSSSASRRK
ncbi:MAG: outer membrane lipoprotein carrier protein LolA [Alphaproteobacteria bacterium]|nr:outer membrane lipoprotein carrier protein LolA [Alphaproteobacteria bacterium]MDY4690085.1 outer membrane lipoprotein carrier protein LolA [Alphaproteobacteria bacterium]